MFVQTQLHLFFKIITISLWSMIVWESVLLRRTVCGDIDWHWHHQSKLAWPWWWILLRLSKHQSMSPQTFLLGTTLTRTTILHKLMIWLMGPNLLQNYNFHLRPTFTQMALRTVVAVYEFRVTRNCFWAGFLWKSAFSRVILLKSSINKQEFILQLSSCCFLEFFCDCSGQTYFSHSYFVQYVFCQR